MNSRKENERIVTLGVIAVPVIILILWQFGSMIIGELALPSPFETFSVLEEGLITDRWLLSDLKDTMVELLLGFLFAAVTGLAVGFALGMYRLLRDIMEPFVLNIYAIPKVTLFPIFLIIFGLGMESKIAFAFFHGVFPIIIVTMGAIKDINDVYLRVGRSFRLNPLQVYKEIVFPSILPSLMTGLRLGFNLSFVGVILGEMAASRSGLGYMLMKSEELFYMEKVLSIVIVLTVIAIAVNYSFYSFEMRLIKSRTMS
ncbi:MAG: ABC transporter permease [Pseudomonadota bacterium]